MIKLRGLGYMSIAFWAFWFYLVCSQVDFTSSDSQGLLMTGAIFMLQALVALFGLAVFTLTPEKAVYFYQHSEFYGFITAFFYMFLMFTVVSVGNMGASYTDSIIFFFAFWGPAIAVNAITSVYARKLIPIMENNKLADNL